MVRNRYLDKYKELISSFCPKLKEILESGMDCMSIESLKVRIVRLKTISPNWEEHLKTDNGYQLNTHTRHLCKTIQDKCYHHPLIKEKVQKLDYPEFREYMRICIGWN